MWIAITLFRAGYNPALNKGVIEIHLANNTNFTINADSPAEFAALLAMLNQPNVGVNTANGYITTQVGPVGFA